MTSAKIQRKNTCLNWHISIAIGLTLFAGLNATASYNVSTIAGSAISFSGDGGISTAARLNNPFGVFVHSSGDVYFSDTVNNRIRKITASTGFISTIAGTGTASFSGDNTLATAATLNAPNGIYVDSSANVYIADTGNQRIRKITASTGFISTITGSNSTAGFADGAATTAARFSSPYGVFVDSGGNTYIADKGNHRVRKLVGTTVSTIAGTGTANFTGDNAAATAATLSSPYGVCVDSSNNVYIADTANNRIRMIAGSTASIFGSARTAGNIYTIAGGSVTTAGFAGDGASATAAAVRFNSPYSVCLDSTGNVYIADGSNNRIRMLINTAGTYFGSSRTANFIYTIAGSNSTAGFADGAATTTARFSSPQGVFVDSARNVYIGDGSNDRIRKLTASSNVISTIAGSALRSLVHADGIGIAARFKSPGMMSIDSSGNLYVPDSDNTIRKITTAGGIYSASTLFSASHSPTYAVTVDGSTIVVTDGNTYLMQYTWNGSSWVSNTSLNGVYSPDGMLGGYGLAVDTSYNVYMADLSKSVIWKITPAGAYSVFAGTYGSSGAVNGTQTGSALNSTSGSGTKFNGPTGIAFDSSNNLYVADNGNNTIRKITPSGVVTTIAGTAGTSGFTDAVGTAARFNSPWDIDIDASGNLYVADRGNNIIRKLTNSGGVYTVSTIAGTAGTSGSADGIGATARFNAPTGLAVSASGALFVTDTGNNTIRKILLNSAYSVAPGGSTNLSGSATGRAYITGGGTAVLPLSNTYDDVELSNGILQVSSSAVPVTFNATGGAATLSITSAAALGPLTFTSAGNVQIASSITATISTLPIGDGTMTLTGAGILQTQTDLSASTTPITVSQGTLQVSGSGILPTAATSVANGATLQLGTSGGTVASGAVPGAADIASGGIVAVAAGVTAPSDAFSSATFHSGGILQVGDGATLGQSFTSVA